MKSLLDQQTRTLLRHLCGNVVLGIAVLAAAFLMDWLAELAKHWKRTPVVVFGCELLAAWLFILDLVVIIGTATVGAVRLLRRMF